MKLYSSVYRSNSPLLFTCEHGSKRFPRDYGQLGLTKKKLANCKDWNDPGSLELAQLLSNAFDASLIAANFSRLFIDANRRLDAKIVHGNTFHTSALKQCLLIDDGKQEKLIDIPGNLSSNVQREERNRWNEYVAPFQARGLEIARKIREQNGQVHVFQIHSFYPTYNGKKRRVDIDVASDKSSQLADRLIRTLRKSTDLVIGKNNPWGIDVVDGGVFDAIQHEANSTLIAFDVNNKHLQTPAKIKRIAKILIAALRQNLV